MLVALRPFQPGRSHRPHCSSGSSSRDSRISCSSCSRYFAIRANVRFGSTKSATVMSRGVLLAAACRRCTGMKPSSVSKAKLAVSAGLSTKFAALDLLGHLLC